jgi:hypothetical protein
MTKDQIVEILKDITLPIEEDAVTDTFGKVAFGDPHMGYTVNSILKLQGLPKTAKEPNTSFENSLYSALNAWVDSPDTTNADTIYNYKDVIRSAQKKYPGIFKPITPPGTTLYRGLSDLNPKIRKQLAKTASADWRAIKVGIKFYFLYTTPITYTPNRKIQSWTDDTSVASRFTDDAVLVSKQNSEFAISQELMKLIFGRNERELLHFGKQYTNKVYVAIRASDFYDIMNQQRQSTNLSNVSKIIKL